MARRRTKQPPSEPPPPLPKQLTVRYGVCVNGFKPGDERVYTDSDYIRKLAVSGVIQIIAEE